MHAPFVGESFNTCWYVCLCEGANLWRSVSTPCKHLKSTFNLPYDLPPWCEKPQYEPGLQSFCTLSQTKSLSHRMNGSHIYHIWNWIHPWGPIEYKVKKENWTKDGRTHSVISDIKYCMSCYIDSKGRFRLLQYSVRIVRGFFVFVYFFVSLRAYVTEKSLSYINVGRLYE